MQRPGKTLKKNTGLTFIFDQRHKTVYDDNKTWEGRNKNNDEVNEERKKAENALPSEISCSTSTQL